METSDFINFAQSLYGSKEVALHAPIFMGNERKYVNDAIDSTFVSSVGEYVNKVESTLANITGSKKAIATSNGTSALHLALLALGVGSNDAVITQAFTFVATGNAIAYTGAEPIFIDVDKETLGLSPESLKNFLVKHTTYDANGNCVIKSNRKIVKACIPMHTFGLPAKIDEICAVCRDHKIKVIEDCAESLGSYYQNTHTGNFGDLSAISFNGNKIATAGGGGAVITNDIELGARIKHISTTAKQPHRWHFYHDEIGYNYRMPNLNAALLLGQLELLDKFLELKRDIGQKYKNFFSAFSDIEFINEPDNSKSNFWLNAILVKDIKERDRFLLETNNAGITTRPAWTPLHKLPMFSNSLTDPLNNTLELFDRLINIPSGVPGAAL